MPEFGRQVEEGTQEDFSKVWENTKQNLKQSLFEQLDDHLDTVKGSNKGRTSRAGTVAYKGPEDDTDREITLINDCSSRIKHHELGHMLMDSLGFDNTQEATNRANNKKNYSRWPQFSFGKKDSPPERFMFRRYGDLEQISRHEVTEELIKNLGDQSDIFYVPGGSTEWYEADTYGFSSGNRERKRHIDPFVWADGEIVAIRAKPLSGHSSIEIRPEKEAYMIDRYELTPGLAHIKGQDPRSWSNQLYELLYQINTHWYEAVTKVRKRGDTREKAKKKSPRGDRKSYYLMNTHEFFAELHAIMMTDDTDDIERLRTHNPGLIEAYEDAIIKE